jgi:hypothetical protein
MKFSQSKISCMYLHSAASTVSSTDGTGGAHQWGSTWVRTRDTEWQLMRVVGNVSVRATNNEWTDLTSHCCWWQMQIMNYSIVVCELVLVYAYQVVLVIQRDTMSFGSLQAHVRNYLHPCEILSMRCCKHRAFCACCRTFLDLVMIFLSVPLASSWGFLQAKVVIVQVSLSSRFLRCISCERFWKNNQAGISCSMVE